MLQQANLRDSQTRDIEAHYVLSSTTIINVGHLSSCVPSTLEVCDSHKHQVMRWGFPLF